MFQFKTLVQVIEDFLGLRAEANFLRVAHLMFEGNFFFHGLNTLMLCFRECYQKN